MAKRGRESAASIVSSSAHALSSEDRLQPPVNLTDTEMQVWHQVVSDQPASAFTPTHTPMLEMYCRHVVRDRVLAEQILNFNTEWLESDEGLKRYNILLGMSERESRAASSLATRLRITRQAIDQQTVARTLVNQPKTNKPWETSKLTTAK
jgi:hypothetical protein